LGFERIWSPWRKAYVTSGAKDRAASSAAPWSTPRSDSLVAHGAARNFVVMNLYPYNAGHVMIAPRRHVGSLAEATSEELSR
jgi:ATP adenylyltransferase